MINKVIFVFIMGIFAAACGGNAASNSAAASRPAASAVSAIEVKVKDKTTKLEAKSSVLYLAQTKDLHVHVLGRGPLPVDVEGFFQVSANGKVLFVTRADGSDNTLVFDLVAYAERATIRGVPYADFLRFEGRYAIVDEAIEETSWLSAPRWVEPFVFKTFVEAHRRTLEAVSFSST